ncbi:3-deoxy-7-phosphoheptulonate synthase [Actinokineospora bangkokensis]|uniref:Phospho-2-dehydro-3-deoxyheptonate aldolase n=1 Tax=Actinokineospora bangkokensis TaxID=1193682 RepID=A0A1Q9LLA0_9PSEU|nr:3-deoxy-7-phosphoheptulonate synthase [Actinokineospora bangkokensis]OLR92779.1 3-deoxy-7-phosphoheptulonate synthase [Actinokineospora bangkokensis]
MTKQNHPTTAGSGGAGRAHPVSSPAEVRSELPLTASTARVVRAGRTAARAVLAGRDDRLLAVVGPCSIHDVEAGLSYAESLAGVAAALADDLVVVMRVYVEKPRTSAGWTGLLPDPGLDGGFDLDRGVRAARSLMLQVAGRGLPVATEWLSPSAPAYLADVVSWGAIGARTVESQVHRQLASGLPMPVGMKNGSTGSVKVALDAMRFASRPQAYLTPGQDGRVVALRTSGNPDCHVVLRGGADRPNYHPEHVESTVEQLAAAGLPTGVVIDASHGNCGKDHVRQARVAAEIADQVAGGCTDIRGVMLESFLVPGRQDLDGQAEPVFGQSVTDACMGWDATVRSLHDLATAVRGRRKATVAA